MSNIIKFSFILICYIITLISYRFCFSKRDWMYLSAGMLFTLISDLFLLILQNEYIGLYAFCFVHFTYILRVSYDIKQSLFFVIIMIICYTSVLFYFDSIIAIALLYALLFACDIAVNVRNSRRGTDMPRKNQALILTGLILFALCDINVLIYNIPYYVSTPNTVSASVTLPSLEWIAKIAYSFIWVFYSPAQFLLSISGFKTIGKKERRY